MDVNTSYIEFKDGLIFYCNSVSGKSIRREIGTYKRLSFRVYEVESMGISFPYRVTANIFGLSIVHSDARKMNIQLNWHGLEYVRKVW